MLGNTYMYVCTVKSVPFLVTCFLGVRILVQCAFRITLIYDCAYIYCSCVQLRIVIFELRFVLLLRIVIFKLTFVSINLLCGHRICIRSSSERRGLTFSVLCCCVVILMQQRILLIFLAAVHYHLRIYSAGSCLMTHVLSNI